MRSLVCEEHKQNNSQLIPGPWRLEKGRGPRHSHIAEKQRSQELGSWTIALHLTPTQLEFNYLLITCKDYWLIMNLGQQSETHCLCSAAVISGVRCLLQLRSAVSWHSPHTAVVTTLCRAVQWPTCTEEDCQYVHHNNVWRLWVKPFCPFWSLKRSHNTRDGSQ